MSKAGINLNERNGMWKGDAVGYAALHEWVAKRFPPPLFCQKCHKEKKLDLANKSDLYLRDLSDWEWLCRKCHMISDGRLDIFAKKKRAIVKCSTCGKEFEKKLSRVKKNNFCSLGHRNPNFWVYGGQRLLTNT